MKEHLGNSLGYRGEEGKITEGAVDNFLEDMIRKDRENTLNQIAELIKTKKISQVVLHSKEKTDPGKEEGLTMKPDLGARGALFILDLIEKELGNVYREDAVASFISKSGTKKDLTLEKDGLRMFIDCGGNWLGVETTNGNVNVNIDHHGSGKGAETSGSEIMYQIYKIIKKEKPGEKEPPWLRGFVKLINDVDNLSYIDEINKTEKEAGGFNKRYFAEKWPNSVYAIAEKIPFEILKEMFESGKIKDPSHLFTKEELAGEIGKIKVGEKTIAELCAEQRKRASESLRGVENANNYAHKRNLNLFTPRYGKIIYHDYFPVGKFPNGREKYNTIHNDMAFLATRAFGFNTLVSLDKRKNKGFVNSTFYLEDLAKDLKMAGKDIRGTFLFLNNIDEKTLLDAIDKKILARAKEYQK